MNIMASVEIDGIYYNLSNTDNTASIAGGDYHYLKYKGDIVIPEKVTYYSVEYSVTTIESKAFYNCYGITSITIPSSITTIGNLAFYGCSNLTSFSIPNSVTSIKDNAFQDCCSLTSLIIPNNLTSLGNDVFQGCFRLTSLIVESNNTVYDSRDNCNAIILTSENTLIVGCASTVIPNSVTAIGKGAFAGCSSLTDILIPNSVKKIGAYAFSECSSLKKVNIPHGITTIDRATFSGCTSLYDISIPEGVTSINEVAFSGTKALYSLHLPISVQKVASTAFYNSDIKEVYSDSIFFCYGENRRETEYSMPDGIKVIGPKAIISERLKVLHMPNSVTKICEKAISCKQLEELIVPDKVDCIEDYAISGSHIKKVVLGGYLSYVYRDAFEHLPQECEIFVPRNTLSILSIWRLCTNLNNVVKDTNTGKTIYKYGVNPFSATSILFEEFTPKDNNVIIYSQKWKLKKLDGSSVVIEKGRKILGISQGEYTDVDYELKYKRSGFGDYSINASIWNISSFIPSLKFTLSQPRVISPGNVIVAAESNIDDEETNVGFEWRRTDWTDDFTSNSGGAYLFEGTMEGYIRNLNTEKLWKYRPYYESNSGNRYYGDWVGIDPTNTSYFEPTVHTYAQVSVDGNKAMVKGYVMRGSDNVTAQGFKYWKATAKARSAMSSNATVPSTAMTITASGNIMEAELPDLDFEATYYYVTFVTTSEGETFYGEERTFTTGSDITGIEGVTTSANETVEVARYDLRGRKLATPQPGLNIIRMSDGTTRKQMVK